MKQYLDMMRDIMENGEETSDRTGVGTKRLPGYQLRFDLQKGFPLVTTKFTGFRLFTEEMLWFVTGACVNAKALEDKNVNIWREWGNQETRDMGPIYGYQWRNFEGVDYNTKELKVVDQLAWAINEIKTNPNSRRIIVSAWNPAQLGDMALPPCHTLFQFLVINGKLHCHMFQRSCDTFLGVPFNIGQYALLTHIIANICDLEVGSLVHTLSDAHIYQNHYDQVEELLSREPFELPTLKIKRKFESIDDNISFEDFELVDYKYHPSIKAPVAV